MTRVSVPHEDRELVIPDGWSVWTFAGRRFHRNAWGDVCELREGQSWPCHTEPIVCLTAAKEGEDVLDCSEKL